MTAELSEIPVLLKDLNIFLEDQMKVLSTNSILKENASISL